MFDFLFHSHFNFFLLSIILNNGALANHYAASAELAAATGAATSAAAAITRFHFQFLVARRLPLRADVLNRFVNRVLAENTANVE